VVDSSAIAENASAAHDVPFGLPEKKGSVKINRKTIKSPTTLLKKRFCFCEVRPPLRNVSVQFEIS